MIIVAIIMPSKLSMPTIVSQIGKWHTEKPIQLYSLIVLAVLIGSLGAIAVARNSFAQMGPPPPIPPTVTVTMTSPIDGACVSGTFSLVASVANGTATQVQVMFNGIDVPAYYNDNEDGTWTFALPSEGFLDDGPATFGAHATVNGTPYASDPITLTIDNATDCAGGGGGGGGGQSLQIVIPSNGETVSGSEVAIGAILSGDQFDNVVMHLTGPQNDDLSTFFVSEQNGYLALWDTTDFTNGEYQIVAEGMLGETTVSSDPISVTVSNAAPQQTIISPENGATISDEVTFIIEAPEETTSTLLSVYSGDNDSNTPVGIFLEPQFDSEIGKWTITWDSKELPNGTYTAVIRMQEDSAESLSNTVNFTIQNTSKTLIIVDQTSFLMGYVQNGIVDEGTAEFVVNGVSVPLPARSSVTQGATSWLLPLGYQVTGTKDVYFHATIDGQDYVSRTIPFNFVYSPLNIGSPSVLNGINVQVTSPSSGAVLHGSTELKALVNPAAASMSFEIYPPHGVSTLIDAQQKDGAWAANWDTSGNITQGTFAIVAVAKNEQGVAFHSSAVYVTVEALRTTEASNTTTTNATSTSSEVEEALTSTSTQTISKFDVTVTSTYSALMASGANLTIDVGLNIQPSAGPMLCTPGSLIKLEDDKNPGTTFDTSVYYCAQDGKRYGFPSSKVFFSWYDDFSNVKAVPSTIMFNTPLGGNVSYRPGIRMIKIQTDPKVYAVSRGGILRWVTTEALAKKLYGDQWNTLVDDVSDALFVNYHVGLPITQ
jgi:hypothetical protein